MERRPEEDEGDQEDEEEEVKKRRGRSLRGCVHLPRCLLAAPVPTLDDHDPRT